MKKLNKKLDMYVKAWHSDTMLRRGNIYRTHVKGCKYNKDKSGKVAKIKLRKAEHTLCGHPGAIPENLIGEDKKLCYLHMCPRIKEIFEIKVIWGES